MRRIAGVLLAALCVIPATASAQWGYVSAGAGMVMPTGDAADAMKTGWMGSAGLGWIVPSMRNWSFQAEFIYSGHSSKALGASSSESELAWQVSGGYSWKVTDKMNFWAEVRYMSSGDGAGKYTAMPIAVRLGWPLGMKK